MLRGLRKKLQPIEIPPNSDTFHNKIFRQNETKSFSICLVLGVEKNGFLRVYANRSECIFLDECAGHSVRSFFHQPLGFFASTTKSQTSSPESKGL